MNEDEKQIYAGLKQVHAKIEDAIAKAGRKENSVKLLLATKTVTADRIKVAIDAGETLIGENKVQEYTQKFEAIKDLPCERHFIGHLQTNKIKEVLKYVTCIQSVDSIDLAEKLDKRLQFEGRSIDIYIQVNTSFEKSKYGIEPAGFLTLLKRLNTLDTLKIRGLMTIGLLSENEQQVKRSYQMLREIKHQNMENGLLPIGCEELSMGMSHDMEWAIAEGATMVRVGSAIFGKRDYAPKS